MRGFVLGLSLSVAFIAGSLFGSLAGSTADAQQGRQRWEYNCRSLDFGRSTADETVQTMNQLGSQGWELVGAPSANVSRRACFKRRL